MLDTPVYWYAWAQGNTTDYHVSSLMDSKRKSGLNSVTLAFVIGNGRGGFNPMVSDMLNDIKEFIASGGVVYISFGGAAAPDVASIMTENAIFTEMEKLYLDTGCKGIDWDIEGGEIANTITNTIRANVIKRMQEKYPKMYFSLTLPAIGPAQWTPGGLDHNGLNCFNIFKNIGVNITVLRLMIMDNYQPDINWSIVSVATLEAAKIQLHNLYPTKNDAEIYKMLLPIFMAGTNDDHTIFSLKDATVLTNYVIKNKLAGISYWAFQRDQAKQGSLPVSTQISQENFDFWNIIKTVNSNPNNWSPNVNYKLDDIISYSGKKYICNTLHTSSRFSAPSMTVWKSKIQPQPPSQNWMSDTNYIDGDIIYYNGKAYICNTKHTSSQFISPTSVWKLN